MINNSLDENTNSQTVLNEIVLEYMKEQKRKRRFKWVFRSLILFLIIFAFYRLFTLNDTDKSAKTKPHVGLIDLNGTIFDSQEASAENFAKGLDDAYKNQNIKALIIRINSPGGSPVQADYMFNSLRYYRAKYPDIKTYAVCVDICASAAYYIAAAADEIYANPSSMVGSIGVLYNGFGFVDAMQKIGVTRRLQTAGKNKAILDPFSPTNPEQEQYLQSMLDNIHQIFIDRVKEGRGDRLKINENTFSGLFWTGMPAKEQGLIDGFASSGQVARDIIQIEDVVDYTHKQSVLDRFAKNIGTAMVKDLPLALGMKEGMQM